MIPVMRPWLGEEEVTAAAETIRSGWVAQGPRVSEFERRFSGHVHNDEGIAVSSCTTGLHLVLHALGIGPGDEVIVPSLSFIATANAPRYVGATPVFADVELHTQNLTVETIAPVVTDRTRSVVVVHQIGMPADLDSIRQFCDDRGIHLIEDAACAAGSTYRGSPIGSAPGTAVFSFHPRKILTTGEGGMIVTPDGALAERMRRLRQHAMSVSASDRHSSDRVVIEEYAEMGFNFRMTDIQAAVGLVQLQKLPEMIERRRFLADIYRDHLGEVGSLMLPSDPPHGTTNYQSYSVMLGSSIDVNRDDLMRRLLSAGVSTRRGVMASHLEPAFAGGTSSPLPVTELLAARSLILPLYHEMSSDDVVSVARRLKDALGGEVAG